MVIYTDAAGYVAHQQIKPISDDYHESQRASHGEGHITQTTIDQQWDSQLINDAEFTANTQLPSVTFDVNNSYVSQQLGQRVGEEVSHFYHPTPPPRNPSGFWQRVEQRYKTDFERQALIAEGRAAANSEVMHESLGNTAANQQNYLDLGYSESIVETRVAEWMSPIVASASPPVTKLPIFAAKTYSLMNKWGLFGHNGAESLETGGRQIETVVGWNKVERQAIQYYKKIRFANSNTDVVSISKNTGIPEYRIQRVKEHLFFNEHTLSGGKVGRFDPYIEIADSWERLRAGSFVQQDLDLLNHEYFESRFEALYRTDYTTAHNAAVLSGRDWNPDGFVSTLEMIWRP